MLFRAQEISRYVVDGIIDCGLTGYDWIVENGNEDDVVEICELDVLPRHAATRPLGAGRAGRERRSATAEDFEGKIIATELVNTTRSYFADAGREA